MNNHSQHTHIGAYAAIVKDGNLLVIKKTRGPYTGKLDLPGGTLEFGESVLDGLQRELKEEIGLDADSFTQLANLTHRLTYEKDGQPVDFYHIGLIYTHILEGESVDMTISDHDVDGAVWIPLGSADRSELSPFTDEVVTLLSGPLNNQVP